MKELSIEEKAKRYDEAIEIAKSNYDTIVGMDENCTFARSGIINTFHHMFPELKEGEDERIRKELIDFIYNKTDTYELREKSNSWLAWLEKQGEHANFRNKIQIGDKVTRNEDGVLVNLSQLKRVAKKDEKQGENNMGISEATKKKLEDNLNKALEKETPESCNEFLDKQSEQKPWTEEDEKMFEHIIAKATLHFSSINYLDEEEINFLKSLKDRYTWKPSEEQMDALHYVTNFDYGGHKATLVSLYEQLKKLRKE